MSNLLGPVLLRRHREHVKAKKRRQLERVVAKLERERKRLGTPTQTAIDFTKAVSR